MVSDPSVIPSDPAEIDRRECHDDRGAVALGAPHGELTTHRVHALLDAQQPVALPEARRIEATPVVEDVQADLIRSERQSRGQSTRLGVTDRVRQDLLTDTEEIL